MKRFSIFDSACRSGRFRFWIAAVVLLTCHSALVTVASATTVTGTVRGPDGAGITGKLELELTAPGRVSDPALLLVQPKVNCAIAAGGVAVSCAVRGNDTIADTTTEYRVRILDANGRALMERRRCSITGASWDVSAAASCAKE